MLSQLAFVLVLAQVTAAAIDVQRVPGMPRRDSTPEQKGTASLSGRVVSADSGTQLRRATVRISARELRVSRSTVTDRDGRYHLNELPAGSYTVMATKGGYVAGQFGQKSPNAPGKTITLADGQKQQNADIALFRGGVITGFISDEYGEPLAEARVEVLRLRWVNGQRRPIQAGRGVFTNDRGEFRIWGLAPGEYLVAATAGDQGWSDEESSDRSGYAPTYFAGTPVLDDAQRVTVVAGEESAGVSFALTLTRTVKISGMAIDSDGKPMTDGAVMLMPRSGGGPMVGGRFGARIDHTGAFSISGVAPGEYTIQAFSMGRRGMGEGDIASATISVAGEDISNLVLVASKGVRMRGRVTFDTPPPADLREKLRIFVLSTDFAFGRGGPGRGEVTPHGTFQLEGLQPGKRRVVIEGLPSDWTIKAVLVGGVDVADTGLEIGKDDITGVEIQLTSRVTGVTGSVRDDRNQPVGSYVVLVFSADERHWQQALGTRRQNVGRPDQNGVYRVRGLAPGSYYAIAVPEMPDDWGDPELMERVVPLAERFSLDEGELRSLDLTLRTLPGSL